MKTLKTRIVVVSIAAALPLTMLAQTPSPTAAPARSAPAAQTAAPSPDDVLLKKDGYQTPPQDLADAVLAPRYLNLTLSNLSPDKKWFLTLIGDGPVVMKTFSKPFDELGGLFIDFKANRSRTLTITNSIGIQVISAFTGVKKTIQVPPGARVSNAIWSPDSNAVAYYVHNDEGTEIWIASVATGQSRQLTTTPVLATLFTNFVWSGDSKSIATVFPPDGRGPRPSMEALVPTGPEIKVSAGSKASLRTFPSLMTTPQDFALLEWHATGQVALVDVSTRAVRKVGASAMVRSVDLSPDGQYLRVLRMTKPFSYIVPVSNFGSVEEVWDLSGKALAEITSRPINLGAVPDDPNADPAAAPQGGGRGAANDTGKRELAWRTDGPGFTYLEQEPAPPGSANGGGAGRTGRGTTGGGAGRAAGARGTPPQGPPRHDRLMEWLPPFDATSTTLLYDNATLMSNLMFSPDHAAVFFTERTGQTQTENAVYLADPSAKYTFSKYDTTDFYANPGTVVALRGGAPAAGRGGGGGGRGGGGGGGGTAWVSADGTSVFMQGNIYDKNPDAVGPKTFLDRVTIKTGDKARLFESDNQNVYERLSTVLDPDAKTFIVVHESPVMQPQDVLVTGATRTQLTANKDIAPDLTNAPKLRVPIERPDGFKFTVRVTLPPGYQTGTKLPALFWVYPSEYDTQEAHDQPDRTYNRNAFTNYGTRSMEFFVREGYAVIEDAPDHLPIVGPTGRQNDNYVDDLRNDLAAVIDELDRRGVIDRQRLAIGGHSYGAFTTVNAMVHTPFFKAGIAGDGNYNRTLTPFGFQNERRTLWDAPNVYFDMSPLFYANHLTGALLMYHNLHDQNVGTDPINSERLFEALNELGKTTAMYRYPFEDHGPVAKETLLDMWARWGAWLDKYVKNPQPVTKPAPAGTRSGGGGH
jgi:dipeptidyl aminopeptidase/acylaminoacyl peptidase